MKEQEIRMQDYKVAMNCLSNLAGATLSIKNRWEETMTMVVVGVSYFPEFNDGYELRLVDFTEGRHFGESHKLGLTQEQAEALVKEGSLRDVRCYDSVQRID